MKKKYVCTVCGWVYDPDKGDPDGGILPGTPFEEIPYDWVCPLCGVGKDDFEVQEECGKASLLLLSLYTRLYTECGGDGGQYRNGYFQNLSPNCLVFCFHIHS